MARFGLKRLVCDGVGMVTNWIAVYGVKCGNLFMRVIAPILFLLCQLAILSILYFFFLHILPSISTDSYGFGVFHCALAVLLGFNIEFNHWACFLTSAGCSAQSFDDAAEVFGDRIALVDGRRVRQIRTAVCVSPGVTYRFCKKCKVVKPPRAHHDSVTNKCAYEMDHFCPWMNNCVGYYNYRYFILFMFWLLLGCLDCLYLSGGHFIKLKETGNRFSLSSPLSQDGAMVFVFTVTLSGAISVSILLGWHIFLMLTNQTTIEFYMNAADRLEARGTGAVFKNPYDLGWRKNLRRVFGDVPWYLALLPSLRVPPEPMYPFEFSFDLFQTAGSSNV